MRPFDAVLRLRPTNVANRAGAGSQVCVLNPRDLLRAQGGAPRVVACFELGAVLPLASGVLRAASHVGAAVGLGMPAFARGEGPTSYAFFQDALAAAADAGLRQPMFLRAGPVALRSTDPAELLRAQEAVYGFVDAGFTEVALEVGWLEPAEAAAAVSSVAAPARERELSVVVVAGDAGPESLAELAGALRAQGAGCDAIALPAGTTAEGLAELAAAVAPLALEVADPFAPGLAAEGVARASLSRALDAVVAAALPAGLRSQVADWMEGSGGSSVRALGHFWRELAALDEGARIRMEALAYHAAVEALDSLGARGSGAAAVQFLAENSGY